MNVFRLVGDLCHLAAIVLLLWKIWKSRSVGALSGKSQILFLTVFATRYVDVFLAFISMYNTTMKLLYVAASSATVYFIFFKFRSTYMKSQDTFRIEFLLIPCALMALLINHEFEVIEILWAFSIYLESVAILPQLFMLVKTQQTESITSHYLFCLGMYRALYILNWIYRFIYEDVIDLIAVIAGFVQTVLYCDFFYLYIASMIRTQRHGAQI